MAGHTHTHTKPWHNDKNLNDFLTMYSINMKEKLLMKLSVFCEKTLKINLNLAWIFQQDQMLSLEDSFSVFPLFSINSSIICVSIKHSGFDSHWLHWLIDLGITKLKNCYFRSVGGPHKVHFVQLSLLCLQQCQRKTSKKKTLAVLKESLKI